LVILGFPSNEFGAEEYETDDEIAAFARKKNFPGLLVRLGHVTGPFANEVWKFFMKATGARAPVWNFDGKFLVSKTGQVSLPTGGDFSSLEVDIARLVAAED
jgi:glutathione peroxidase